jgi:hypothetical protein
MTQITRELSARIFSFSVIKRTEREGWIAEHGRHGGWRAEPSGPLRRREDAVAGGLSNLLACRICLIVVSSQLIYNRQGKDTP